MGSQKRQGRERESECEREREIEREAEALLRSATWLEQGQGERRRVRRSSVVQGEGGSKSVKVALHFLSPDIQKGMRCRGK